MKGLCIAAILILLFTILVTGCIELEMAGFGWMFDVDEPVGTVCESPAARLLEPSGLDPDHCFQQLAVNTNDLDLCGRIERGAPLTKCYLMIAEKNGDSSICSRIPDTSDPQAYLPIDCLWSVARSTGDPAVCEEMGTARISRMFIGKISRETCLQALGVPAAPASPGALYNATPENFRQCQDLAYAAVFGRAPSTTTGASKQEVGERLLSSSYSVSSQGCVAEGETPQIPLSSGDVIAFDFDTVPDPKNAAHYAVVERGKISQILNFPQAGAYNQTGDIGWFFARRTVYNPYNDNQPVSSPRVYHCYTVYHRRA